MAPEVSPGPFHLRDAVSSAPAGATHEFALGANEDGLRLDRVLASRSEAEGLGLSRTRLQQLIRDGLVDVDGSAVRDPGAKTKAGAHVRIIVPPPQKLDVAGEDIPLNIVFEDDAPHRHRQAGGPGRASRRRATHAARWSTR